MNSLELALIVAARGRGQRRHHPGIAAAAAALCARPSQRTLVAPQIHAAGRRDRRHRRDDRCRRRLPARDLVRAAFNPASLWLVFAATAFIAMVGVADDIWTHRGRAAAAAANARRRRRDRKPSRGAARPADAAVVDRARAAAAGLPLVRQSDEFHGRHRLDDDRRIRADRHRARCHRMARGAADARRGRGAGAVRRL